MKNKTELKTLKNLKHYRKKGLVNGINELELKKEAIKWVKEDKEHVYYKHQKDIMFRDACDWLLKRWMERFNITSEDLK